MKNYLIISILLDLLKHEKVKASDLAEKNEVSVRTIYRYIDSLESAGVPTTSCIGKNGGVGIDKNFKIDTALLNSEEKDYLKTLITNNPSSFSDNLAKKLNL